MLLEQNYGMRKEKTAYGCSLCFDDVSTRPGGLLQQLLQQWGDVFFLGGLGGVPFVGKTGFEAFLARVPEGGDAVVLFGPHMGMLPTGEMGEYLCKGKTEPVPAGRAWVTAWQQCLAQRGSDNASDLDPLDMQQAWLRSQLAAHSEDIAKAKAPMAALAYQAYDLVAEKLYAVLDANMAVGRLVLLGGIHISMPDGFEDHFLPIDFEVLQEGQKPKDHMDIFNKW